MYHPRCPKCQYDMVHQGMGKLFCEDCDYTYALMEHDADFFGINIWLSRANYYHGEAAFEAARYRNLTGNLTAIKVGTAEQFDCIALIAFDLYIQELRENDDFEAMA